MPGIGDSILYGGGAGAAPSITTAGIGWALTIASPAFTVAVAPIVFPAAIGVGLLSSVSFAILHYSGEQTPAAANRIDQHLVDAANRVDQHLVDATNRFDQHVVEIGENIKNGLLLVGGISGCLGAGAYNHYLKNNMPNGYTRTTAIATASAGLISATSACCGLYKLYNTPRSRL